MRHGFIFLPCVKRSLLKKLLSPNHGKITNHGEIKSHGTSPCFVRTIYKPTEKVIFSKLGRLKVNLNLTLSPLWYKQVFKHLLKVKVSFYYLNTLHFNYFHWTFIVYCELFLSSVLALRMPCFNKIQCTVAQAYITVELQKNSPQCAFK